MSAVDEKIEDVETKADAHSVYDILITDDIDFRVETRTLETVENSMKMPEHSATVRINPDGTEQPLWVVGSRYEVVDHRDVIKGFAEALDKAGIEADVEHKVFGNGCRIYSFFTLDKTYSFHESKAPIRPFFSLTTSHDGSLKMGFMVGATVDGKIFNVSKTIYGAAAKHTRGINVEKTLDEIEKALNAFVEEVVPMWERMQNTSVGEGAVEEILKDAVNKKVLAKRRAEDIDTSSCKSVWDVYDAMINEVSTIRTKRGTEERTFDRNTKVGEYFRKLAMDKEMKGLRSVIEGKMTY